MWVDVKAILNSCEYGEDVAKETYEKALENDLESLLVADHNKVKSMRDLVMAD